VKRTGPVFQNVVDLGLRDVGVRNDPRRLAAHFGRWLVPVAALAMAFAVVPCLLLRQVGADAVVVIAFALGWTAVVFAVALRMVKRSPVVVVRITAEGTNQAAWMLLTPFVALVPALLLLGDPKLIPVAVMMLLVAGLGWRSRGRVPEHLRRFRTLLASDEEVLGDGIGMVRGAVRGEAQRLLAATDRRLIVSRSAQAEERFVVLDAPYERLLGFGIAWTHRGRTGELTLTVAGDEGAPPATHVVSFIAPANLVSIARALRAHGVRPDDPAGLVEAERAWEQARVRGRKAARPGTNTREFDLGLWLMLGLCALLFYLNPLGVGLGASREVVPVLPAVAVVGAVCGYVSRTRASLLYLVPLNLLVTPAFFFASAGEVIGVMVALSALAAVGLWVGSALREATGRDVAATPRAAAPRGSLGHALSGRGLVRISAVMLATMLALTATAGAAGLPLTSLRLAVDEWTAHKLPVDGRSNLNGGAASLSYTPGGGLRELVTDESPLAGPYDGARWELRSSFTKGYNAITLGHYIVRPELTDGAAVARFIAEKDGAHSRLAGFGVTHTTRVVDGRKGYVWDHRGRDGTWYFAAWFPQRVHSVRVECIGKSEAPRFKRLCAQAMGSLKFAG
jgi:hypothetical protein